MYDVQIATLSSVVSSINLQITLAVIENTYANTDNCVEILRGYKKDLQRTFFLSKSYQICKSRFAIKLLLSTYYRYYRQNSQQIKIIERNVT